MGVLVRAGIIYTTCMILQIREATKWKCKSCAKLRRNGWPKLDTQSIYWGSTLYKNTTNWNMSSAMCVKFWPKIQKKLASFGLFHKIVSFSHNFLTDAIFSNLLLQVIYIFPVLCIDTNIDIFMAISPHTRISISIGISIGISISIVIVISISIWYPYR